MGCKSSLNPNPQFWILPMIQKFYSNFELIFRILILFYDFNKNVLGINYWALIFRSILYVNLYSGIFLKHPKINSCSKTTQKNTLLLSYLSYTFNNLFYFGNSNYVGPLHWSVEDFVNIYTVV